MALLQSDPLDPPVLYPWDHGYSQYALGVQPTYPHHLPTVYGNSDSPDPAPTTSPSVPHTTIMLAIWLLLAVLLLVVVALVLMRR